MDSDTMDGITSLWLFNIFVVGMMAWLYYYFWSMFHAIAEMNDTLIEIIGVKKSPEEDEMQQKLDKFGEQLSKVITWICIAVWAKK